MEFPDRKRVIFANNPLSEVVFQVRFPRILAIDDRLPADFQQLIAHKFPLVESHEGIQLPFAPSTDITSLRRVFYHFSTEEGETKVTLCSDFLAVTTYSYERWEKFREAICCAIDALTDSYTVQFFIRTGLRYVDHISKRRLGLEDFLWSDLVKQTALGIVAEDEIPMADMVEAQNAIVLQLPNQARVAIRTGFSNVEDSVDEKIFVVDSDFYTEEVIRGKNDVVDRCITFNRYAGHAFRWFISERLEQALEPKEP